MSFTNGLSGINAANKQLDVAGNNIANVATTGFKSSRAEFADVYSTTLLGTVSSAIGRGVRLANVSQQFNQGDLKNTGNALDLSIRGSGFFVLGDNGSLSYSRAGAFKVNAENVVVDNTGHRLQGYGADLNGNIAKGALADLKIDKSHLAPHATTRVEQTVNLNSAQRLPSVATFNPADPNSYNHMVATPVYDSQGNRHAMEQYYVKLPLANSWTVHTFIDGRSPADPVQHPPVGLKADLTFNANGTLGSLTAGTGWSKTGNTLTLTGWRPGVMNNASGHPPSWSLNGARGAVPGIALDFGKTTSFAAASTHTAPAQDGYPSGQISGLTIDATGIMNAKFSNGQTKAIGQVALASFTNEQGLQPAGGTRWKETFASGLPGIDAPGAGSAGVIVSNSLEASNVDLTNELVNLIQAQRNYQANAKTLTTQNKLLQTVIQMK